MDAREHFVAEWLLAAVAIGLTTAVVVGSMFSRTSSPDAQPATAPPAAAPTSTVLVKPTTSDADLVVQVGFEAGLKGWRPIGVPRIRQDPRARAGRWAARFDGTGAADQGMAFLAVLRCKPGRSYEATVWVRASRPGTLLQVNLLESVRGERYATDTVGAVLGAGGWQHVEVAHRVHRPGATLAFEAVLPRGSPRASILIDDLKVMVHKASFMSHRAPRRSPLAVRPRP